MSIPHQRWTTPVTDEFLHGVVELERTDIGVLPHRLPAWARNQTDDPRLAMVESQPSGARLLFSTEGSCIELRGRATRFRYEGAPPQPDGVFDLVVEGHHIQRASLDTATVVSIDMTTGARQTISGKIGGVVFDGLPQGPKTVELWLPHNETVELVEVRSDAPIRPVRDPRPVWLHHGSSISHGSNAVHPTGIWPVVAAMRAGLNLLNLGFGGSALLDPFTARTIRDTPADLISVKLGINLVNLDLMRLRAFTPAVHGFLDTIRDGHPRTPLLVVSPILCPIHEHTPGPGAFDPQALARGDVQFQATGDPSEVAAGKLTLTVIREQLARIVAERAQDDPYLFYLDGRELYGYSDAREFPLPDALHPDPATHLRMGKRFADLAFGEGAPLATDRRLD
ncbi:SGNH/GDSL hydrolase family protein [Kocuria rosea]|uniref:SGNH/GDSL hydrolase family protein n=1 Tax=Kocuria rosea TaxID=1275 RepID=UPI00203F621B|nr:SGNH/GDSL hydrolase family protein [Kocuria rosea]MCM3689406.1 lipase [Kocuria rosea]